MDDILWSIRPRLVGPDMNQRDYIRWKMHHARMNFEKMEILRIAEVPPSPPFVPISIIPKTEHKTPPRKKDLIVILSQVWGDRYGVITYVDKDNNTVGVWLFKDKEHDSFDLDAVETYSTKGKTRWCIHC